MLRKVLWIFFIEIAIALHHGHEVGRTSMESTHYDRQRFEQTCSINKQLSSNLRDSSVVVNQTNLLDMDQASLNITVDKQVNNKTLIFVFLLENYTLISLFRLLVISQYQSKLLNVWIVDIKFFLQI